MVMRLVSNPEAAAAFALASDGLSPAYALLSNSIVTGRAARRIVSCTEATGIWAVDIPFTVAMNTSGGTPRSHATEPRFTFATCTRPSATCSSSRPRAGSVKTSLNRLSASLVAGSPKAARVPHVEDATAEASQTACLRVTAGRQQLEEGRNDRRRRGRQEPRSTMPWALVS